MKKKITAFILAVLILASLVPAALAASPEEELSADILYTLGLIDGDGGDFALERRPTRAEAVALIARISGNEDEVRSGSYSHPFTDVPKWADKYIGWAYAEKLVEGKSATKFGSSDRITAQQYETMLLRLLGYSDGDGDFSYASAERFAIRTGLAGGTYGKFTRADMFDITLSALTYSLNGGGTLIEKLVESGDVSRAKANAVGLCPPSLSARQVYDRYSSAVFYLECFSDEESYKKGEKYSNSSGFFISADGVAVTNCHCLESALFAEATLPSGETFTVQEVLYYDVGIDIAVIRVSQRPVGGGPNAVFPYLPLASGGTVSNGDIVYAIGNPLGLTSSISSGIVGFKDRPVDGFTMPMIQNSADISTGSSGGALFNDRGQVIGITAAYYIYGNSMYLAVPVEAVLSADLSGHFTLEKVAADIAEANAAKEAE